MSELVSGLLAHLDALEREHHRAAEEMRQAARMKISNVLGDYVLASIADGLRLCRAHRDILDMHDCTKRLLDQANERVLQQVMDGTVATRQEQRDFDSLHVEEAVLQEVIEALAVGLGVEETEDR